MFSFSKTGCHIKVKETYLLNCFTHNWIKDSWIQTFPEDISAMWNPNYFVQDLNSRPFPPTVTITPQTFPITKPSARVGCETRSVFKRKLISLNSEISFSSVAIPKINSPVCTSVCPSLKGELHIFLSVFVLCERQTVLFKIWTQFPTMTTTITFPEPNLQLWF